MCSWILVTFSGPGTNILKDETLKKVAEKYDKTPAQIALRYLWHLGIIFIPKTANKNRMIENFNVFDFKLMEQDIKI